MSHVSDEQLSLLVDGELSSVHRQAITTHLASCAACAARHDCIVEVVASLRLQPAVAWSAAATQRTVAALTLPAARPEWPVFVAAATISAVVGVLALKLAIVQALVATLHTVLEIVDAFAPTGVSVSSAATVLVLCAIALIGPLLAYPLMRDR